MKESEEMNIPHLFTCPISLELFKDPVTLCTGQTYERSSVEKWLATGNLTCPVTMQSLLDLSFVPNHTLRHLIDQWLLVRNQIDPDYISAVDSLSIMRKMLESREVTLDNKIQTLEKINSLLEESQSSTTTSYLVQLGFLNVLLELAFGKVQVEAKLISQQYLKFVEEALSFVVKMLPLAELESLNILKEGSKLLTFEVLIEHGTSGIKLSLTHLVEAISSASETKDLSVMIGNSHKILRELIKLLDQNSEEASSAGIKAIHSLCSMEVNIKKLVSEGAVNGLTTYITNAERKEKRMAAMAMEAIERILGVESSKKEVIKSRNGIKAMVKMVFKVSDHGGSESAVSSLMIICSESVEAREEAIKGGVLSQLLLLLQSQCSGRTKTKARMLLKLLRS